MSKVARRRGDRGREKWQIELERLAAYDWNGATKERRRHAAEVIHALAYALAAEDDALVRKLKVAAVDAMKERRGYVDSPLGFVAGGPVRAAQTRTDEVIALYNAAREQLTRCRADGRSDDDTAFRVAMKLLAVISSTAPSIRALIPDANLPILRKRDAAVRRTKRVLHDADPEGSDAALIIGKDRRVGILGAVLIVLGIPRDHRKRLLDDARRSPHARHM